MIGSDLEQFVRRIIREEVRAALAETRGPTAYVSPAAYAAAHAIAESTVHAAIADGRLDSEKVGRARRIPADAKIAATRAKAPELDARTARTLGIVRGGR